MIRLEAPYNATQQITVLPNAKFDDEESYDITTIIKKAMDSTVYSYNTRPSTDEKRISLDWENIARGKILEIIEFIELFGGGFIRMIDHRSRIWKVILENNPTSFSINERATPAGYNESGTFSLIFLGIQVGTES